MLACNGNYGMAGTRVLNVQGMSERGEFCFIRYDQAGVMEYRSRLSEE